ncbi:hypothetical protein [Streptomyces sp. NPDC048436]|uniref:hypothetical protein n=1 Tax=Streptomyces sp. NPDC048436 TaxID=3365550 RepID=UPI00371F5EDC
MKKIITVGMLALGTLMLAVPAHADDDNNYGGPYGAADNWSFSTGMGCNQAAAVASLGDAVGQSAEDCTYVLDHA